MARLVDMTARVITEQSKEQTVQSALSNEDGAESRACSSR